jgi:uncharacterized protein YkwD
MKPAASAVPRSLIVSFLLAPLALAGCVSSSSSTSTATNTTAANQFPANLTSPGPLQPTGTVGDATFVPLINGVRTTAGVAPLTYNTQLDAAAQAHANDMLTNNYFSHTGLTDATRTLAIRVQATGYQYKLIGENIAQGQQSEQDVLNGWVASPGHQANNVTPDFEHFGLGQAGTGSNARWVLVFGDPQ